MVIDLERKMEGLREKQFERGL